MNRGVVGTERQRVLSASAVKRAKPPGQRRGRHVWARQLKSRYKEAPQHILALRFLLFVLCFWDEKICESAGCGL